ncbi:MAG: gamma-glutamyltransferase [Pseudomonadota bacterium]
MISAGSAIAQERPLAPEIATNTDQKQAVTGQKFMAVTAHPEATNAAYKILEQGGSAADAGIAAQLVLGLVEPQSSGLGGGAFALYFDAKDSLLYTYDARETAPQSAGPYLFQKDDGELMGFFDAAIGGRAVGVPGVPKLLEQLHEKFGKADWKLLFNDAIAFAEDGFIVSDRMNTMLKGQHQYFGIDTKTKLFFFPDGSHPVEGTINNPDYALTLRDLQRNKTSNFYSGEIAQNIVQKVRESSKRGLLSTEDLQDYEVIEREAVCGNYRGYQVCSMGQPSSGGLTLLIALGILENFDLMALGDDNPQSYHLIAEASRLAFADRNHYMADPDFVATPDTLLLQDIYLDVRAQEIKNDSVIRYANHGIPLGWNDEKQMKDGTVKDSGTTHMTIVDQYGNVLSMTSSIEFAFGSHLMVNGFLLNNQLTDFSFRASDGKGNKVANRVQGGKRPRSSMAPVIVFDPDGKPFMALGSAGGSRIIGYVLQRIIAAIDWSMELQASIDAPHLLHRGKKLEVEKGGEQYVAPLKDLGHELYFGEMNSGLTAIKFEDGNIIGAANPRRDGTAMGQ